MPPEEVSPLTRGDIQQRASRGALWTGLYAVVSLPVNVIGTVIIARLLGAAGYGELAFFVIALAIIQQVTDFGYTSSAVQWGSEARVKGNDGDLRRLLSQVTGFHLFVQGPLSLIASVAVLHTEGVAYGIAYGVAIFFFLYVSAASLALVLDQRNDLLARIALVTNLATQMLVIVVAVITRDPFAVLIVRGVTAALPGFVALFAIRTPLRSSVLSPRSILRSPLGFWKFATYSWVAGCLALLVYSRSEILLLHTLSTPIQTGLFALAFGVSQQLTGPVDALVAPLVPAIASLAAGHGEHLARAVRRAMGMSSLLAGVLLAVAVPGIFALLPSLFGAGFEDSGGLLIALCIVSTFQTATGVLSVVVQAQRKGRSLLIANGAALILDLGLAGGLIPFFGAWGAMVANVCGQVLALVVLLRAAIDDSGGISFRDAVRGTRAWFAALPALGIAIAVVWLTRPSLTGLGSAPVAGLTGLVLFYLFLRVLRAGPEREDVLALTTTLPSWLRRPVKTCLLHVTVE